ncbi:SDR family oxidoreductase [Alloscardovia theropitheci]|uniref:SDR family oxidoreductase n=1 Tax=Alloscardovia theropitheci TaxID=2496842 RepID=A0A4R0QXL0_9BIFI|nr:SDR family oxidoreductase [Alloscardovia theropitheci]TCD54360.1 SDR family oxidoreductase [Alloscardovia theropitheci]
MIGLTGVSGKLGSLVAAELHSLLGDGEHEAVRYIARTPQKLEGKTPAGVELRKASYENSRESVEALTGIDTLFMVSAGESPTRIDEHKAFIDAAKAAGVKHIVYTSFYNAAVDSTFTLGRDHGYTEAYIKESGLTYTFTRDNFYAEFFADMVLEYGELRGPAGDGVCSLVSRHDIARTIATILVHPDQWENTTLNMTGPQELTLHDVVEISSRVLGKDIPYIDESLEEAYASRQQYGVPDWQVDAWVSTYTAIRDGETAGLSNDIERVTGTKPRSFEEVLTFEASQR